MSTSFVISIDGIFDGALARSLTGTGGVSSTRGRSTVQNSSPRLRLYGAAATAGGVISATDIPEDLGGTEPAAGAQNEWTQPLASWAEQQLSRDESSPLLETALPELERTLIRIALSRAHGRRQDAAKLLGWGRNTLTRKIRSLNIDY